MAAVQKDAVTHAGDSRDFEATEGKGTGIPDRYLKGLLVRCSKKNGAGETGAILEKLGR
jgi:hypothetical protein